MTNYSSKPDIKKFIAAPELPLEARLPFNLELDGCAWLDQYIEFSQKWSPRSFDGYHEAIGLWILSTVAARRVIITFGGEKYTNLYMLLVGRTGVHAKTTAVQIAKEFLNNINLSTFLLPDECTPQRMIQDMASKLPDDYSDLSIGVQEKIRQKLTFSGQRGWYYDEFGANIQNMMKKDGPYGEFRGILRKFSDTEPSYVRGTITRGDEEIIKPYLALLGVLTPADIAPVTYRGSMLWGDGYLARMGIIFPPSGILKDDEFPVGKREFEKSLLTPVSDWHEHLGIPKVEVINNQIKRNDINAKFEVNLSPETRAAYYRYDKALRSILMSMSLTDLDGNYVRFPEKVLRISALFAGLEGANEIKINHWAQAQAIGERWRSNLHSLYKQVNIEDFTTPKWTDNQKVLKAIQEKQYPTAREIQQFTGLSSEKVNYELEVLIKNAKVVRDEAGKTNRYRFSK